MRKFLVLSAAVAVLGLFAMSAPADAASSKASDATAGQTMDLSARYYYRHRYYRHYGYYRPYRYYYRPRYYYPYPYYRPYYYPYGYYPYYYRRPGIYFGFGW